MACIACSAELPTAALFCHVCGAPQGAGKCRSCAADLIAGAGFCSVCGTSTAAVPDAVPTAATPPVQGVAERRLTSVLFADLVSYTTLSEARDTEDVRELLTQYFDVCSTVVKRYGGTVEKFIGDAVMAVWGVPTAHEDDAERAVRAALELVTSVSELGETLGLADLALRAGVVTGEVAATVGATDQGMVAGDPVNTAARIQSAASPGEVWVDANTRALTAAAVTYLDVGEHALKGKAEPVRLFHAGTVVAAVGGLQRVDGLEAPLAGRDRELRLLKELFHATEESGRPRLVVLDGEAGVGKTRLAWEFEKYVDGLSSPTKWHRGRCLSYGDGVAFWALAEAVRARLGLLDEDPDVVAADALGHALSEYVEDPDERAWMRPRLASLMGEETGDFLREDLFAAWTRFFERVSGGTKPVVLVIDDGQYADTGMLDFLEHLLGNARAGIFVLLLARPELIGSRPNLGGRRATMVALEPLSDAAMGDLVDGLVDGLPAETRAGLVTRAEGIPLFAVETVRALIDRELVQPFEGRYVVAPGQDVDLSTVAAPASLHALVAARLDALTPDERRVATDASVLGASFTREGIGILAAGVGDLDRVLASLARKEILATETDRFSAERGQYHFVQSVVRQVAYSTLARRDRKLRHLAVADHLSSLSERPDELAVVVAQHLIDAVAASTPDDPDVAGLSERAAALLVVAGDRACALGSYADGLRSFDSALSRLPGGSVRARVLEKSADAASQIGQYDRAIEMGLAALALFDSLGDTVAAGRAAALCGRCYLMTGDSRTALQTTRERYEALRQVPGSERSRARLASVICRGLQALGEHDEALVVQADSLYLAEQIQEPAELVHALSTMVIEQMVRGSTRLALAILREITELSREHGLWDELATAHAHLGVLRVPYSLREGIDHEQASLDTDREHGLMGRNYVAWANLGAWLWTAGEWRRCAELLREFIETSDNLDPGSLEMMATVDQWRVDAGLERIVHATPAVPADDLNSLGWHEHRLMLCAEAGGDLATAVGHAEASVERMVEDAGLADDFVNVWPRAVRVAVAAGDLPLARKLVSVVEDAQPGLVSTAVRAHLLVLRAVVVVQDAGDPVAVEADLVAGVTALDEYGSPPYRARAQEDLGNWLVAQGRYVDAQPYLEAARATYTQLNATAWLERMTPRVSAAPTR